jgi:FAD/FMN-containing dehydrogenase/Fe-S oxidoreductase
MYKVDFHKLSQSLTGECYSDLERRYLASTDGSIYKILPQAVVYPFNNDDIKIVVEFCRQNYLSLHPRGSGGGICGAALGEGIVLDLTKFMNRVLEVNLKEKYIICEAGIKGGKISEILKGSNLFYPVDPSSFEYASIGGMYNANASGSHSVKYGNTNDYVIDAEVILSDGNIFWLSEIEQKKYNDLPKNFKSIFDLYNKNKIKIEKSYPKLQCNLSGYNLRELVKNNKLKLVNLFAGSEGTLGIISQVKLKIIDKPHHNILIIAYFNTIEDSVKAVENILLLNPSAIEIMDKSLLNLAREQDSQLRQQIPGDIDNVLMIECDGNDLDKLTDWSNSVLQILKNKNLTEKAYVCLKESDKDKFWAIRKAAAPMLYKLRGKSKTTHLIESAAIPTSQLVKYFQLMYKLMEKYKLNFSIVGHIAKGVVHTEPQLNLKSKRDVELLKILTDEASDIIISLGGTISGEHGEGLNRSYYIKKQYPEIYPLFVETKSLLDPYNILNPKIKTHYDPLQVKSHLRYGKDYKEKIIFTDLNLHWDYEQLISEVDMCNGCSSCTTPSNLFRMCPIYKFTQDELATPRSKANLIRGLISGELNLELLNDSFFIMLMEKCVNCGACYIECPSNVNIPKLVAEAKSNYYKNHPAPLLYKIVSNLDIIAKIPSFLIKTNNLLLNLPLIKNILSALLQADLKSFNMLLSERNLYKTQLKKKNINTTNKKILFFSGCYYNYMEPKVSEAAIKLLEKSGYNVYYPEQFCCGIPALSKGLINRFKKNIEKNITSWGHLINEVDYIVSACSSCTFALKKEWSYLIDDKIIETIRRKSVLISEILNNSNIINELKITCLYHMPCHLKYQNNSNSSLNLLQTIKDIKVYNIDSNCCGLAGSYGIYNKNKILSNLIGADLSKRINKINTYDIVLTDCPSCRMRLKSITNKKVIHPVELFAQ